MHVDVFARHVMEWQSGSPQHAASHAPGGCMRAYVRMCACAHAWHVRMCACMCACVCMAPRSMQPHTRLVGVLGVGARGQGSDQG